MIHLVLSQENSKWSVTSHTLLQPDLVDLADDVTVLWYALTFLLAVLAFRETLQCGVAPRRYFFSFENLLEVTMIALTATLLFYGPVQCHISAKRQVSLFLFENTCFLIWKWAKYIFKFDKIKNSNWFVWIHWFSLFEYISTFSFWNPVSFIQCFFQISAIIIVLSWSEFITMIGRHPRLSVYNI